MLDFVNSTAEDYSQFARYLWLESQNFSSHEQTSRFIVESLFQEFTTPEGDPLLALARIFRWTPVDELPDDLRAICPPGEKSVMALTGTCGLEDAWWDRRKSANHRVIPVGKIASHGQLPMFEDILAQMGIDLPYLRETGDLGVMSGRHYQGVFYIQDASSSPAILDQRNFVKPYGIKSLLGFGGFIAHPNHESMYLLSVFTRQTVTPAVAQDFCAMQQFIGASVAQDLDHVAVFDE